jgi:hypothetical protein
VWRCPLPCELGIPEGDVWAALGERGDAVAQCRQRQVDGFQLLKPGDTERKSVPDGFGRQRGCAGSRTNTEPEPRSCFYSPGVF